MITNYNGDVYNFLFFLHLSCDYLILFPEQSDKIRQTLIGLIQITVKNSSYNFGPMETSFVFVAEGSGSVGRIKYQAGDSITCEMNGISV